MAEYVVKKGDTLSAIGARNGVDWRQITGFRSGNPNLIYPGEVLRWGSAAPAPAPAAPAPAPAPAGPTAQSQADNEYNTWNSRVEGGYGDVNNFDANAKNPLDLYNSALDKLGIGDARTRVTGLREQLLNTENLLRSVEGNVNSRTAGSLVTEAQRQKLVANERAPLSQQAADLGRNYEGAYADYKDIMGEGKTQADMEYQFQSDQRQALMTKLQVSIDQAKTAGEKQRWQKEFDRLTAKDAEEKRQYEEKFKYQQEQDAKEFTLKQQTAARSGSSGGSSASKVNVPAVTNQIRANLEATRGGDGFVSPTSYQRAKADWIGAGQSAGNFDAMFGYLKNPAHANNPSWQQY